MAQVARQNTQLAQQISSAYETPSEKLKKDPIMGLVTKTVATYMFFRHNNGPRHGNNHEAEDFPSWGNHFSKRRSESEKESRKTVKTKIAGLKTKKTKSTRVKESWKMKADKVKAKRKDLKRSETKREEEKEIKRRQAKAERSPAQKDSIFIPFALAVAFLIFISFIEFVSSFAFLIFPVHFNYQFIYPFRKFAFLDFKEFKDYCLYNIKPYIWQREQKLYCNPWNQQDYPGILKPDHLYPLEVTQEHIGSRNITNIWVRPGFLKIMSKTDQSNTT